MFFWYNCKFYHLSFVWGNERKYSIPIPGLRSIWWKDLLWKADLAWSSFLKIVFCGKVGFINRNCLWSYQIGILFTILFEPLSTLFTVHHWFVVNLCWLNFSAKIPSTYIYLKYQDSKVKTEIKIKKHTFGRSLDFFYYFQFCLYHFLPCSLLVCCKSLPLKVCISSSSLDSCRSISATTFFLSSALTSSTAMTSSVSSSSSPSLDSGTKITN